MIKELEGYSLLFEDIPIFSDLSAVEKELIKEYAQFKEIKKNEIIYQEGSPADAFYCLITGRVLLYTGKAEKKIILEYLHRGKYFGIISLLTGEPHSVTAQAVNDSVLLVIPKDKFKIILEKVPSIAIDLSKTLSRRLKRKDIHQKSIFESTIIGIFSYLMTKQKNDYGLNLALALKDQTRKNVIIVELSSEKEKLVIPQYLKLDTEINKLDISERSLIGYSCLKEIIKKTNFDIDFLGINYSPNKTNIFKIILEILSFLVNDYHYVILIFPSYLEREIFSLFNQLDQLHILVSSDEIDLRQVKMVIERLNKEFSFPKEAIKLIIGDTGFRKLNYLQERNILDSEIFANLPHIEEINPRCYLENPSSEYARAIRRIARQVGDCQVGLALGVGVAYGFCHIGVLKVIEEEKIPIDMIVGASSGALIASLWAIGKTADEILEIAKEFKNPKQIWSMIDFTFPWLGFIKGNKLYRFLKQYLNDKTFYDTKLPLKIVASNVKKKEPLVFDKGPIVDALMTSCAMPGVFRPTCIKEEMLLVDGGVTNPVPCEILFKFGIKKIIAVNVTPSHKDILNQYTKIKEEFQAKGKGLIDYLKNKLRINILDIIFSSIEIMQSEIAQKETLIADVVLHPDTTGLHWLELHRAEEFAKRGEEVTRKNLDRIWQLINE